jgi:hypothetical protein
MPRRLLIALLSCLVLQLAGCVDRHVTYLPDGRQGRLITCGRLWQSWSNCLMKAGRLCKAHGYAVDYEDEVQRELIVTCKSSGG